MSNLSLNIVIVVVLLVIILLVFQLTREKPINHKNLDRNRQVSDIPKPIYKEECKESSKSYNVYWFGDSHSDSGAISYRDDMCEFIGTNLVFPIPPSGPTQVLRERYNEKGISSDGESRIFYVAKEVDLKLKNAWKMIARNQKMRKNRGFLYDFSLPGASMLSNSRLSGSHPSLDPNNNPPFQWFNIEEELDECFDFMSRSNTRISEKDVFWFSGLYNDIIFIAMLGVGFPNNLSFVNPPITPLNIPNFISRVIAKQIELIDNVYQAGGRRVVVELWESIDDTVVASNFWHKIKLAFGAPAIAGVQTALTGMITGLKATIISNLSAIWPELDVKFSNISAQLKEMLDNSHLYGINLDFPAGPYETMIEQNPLTHPSQPSTSFDLVRRTRNLFHWDDAHMTSHSASIQAKFAASILSSEPDDAKIGNFGPAGFC